METLAFSDLIIDKTKDGTKLPTNDYQKIGSTAIIDQGQEFIAGYTDRSEGIFTDVPVIIFGDHTRVFKYIDFPFFLGADGVKILKANREVNYRYLYYYFLQAKFPNTGYARHFKWLKELQIPLPPLAEQKHITAILDKTQKIIAEHKQMLQKYDTLIKSRFIEMFGDNNFQKKKCNEIFITKTGKLDSNAMVEDGEYPFFTCAKEVFKIDKYAFDQEALLLAGNNAAGKYDVKHYKGKFNAYQRTYVLSLKEEWEYPLFKYQLEDKLEYLRQQSLGGLTKYLTLKILETLDFIVPPIELQKEFSTFVQQIDKSKFAVQKSLEKTETLYKSLMQQYFA